jgi:hypothetical protein
VKPDAKSRIVLFRNFASDSITVKSTELESLETMPEGLKEITFRNFGIADGTYTDDDVVSGSYSRGSLDGIVVSGKVTFGTVGGAAQIMVAPEGTWEGLWLCQRDHGRHDSLYLRVYQSGIKEIATLTPEFAGMPLVGEELNLQMSFQLVDNDGDGNKDDLKLGIWFNEVLYNNEYFYIDDCFFVKANKTNQIVLYPQVTGSSITVKSIEQENPESLIDYEKFGLTKDWRDTLLNTNGKSTNADGKVTAVGGSQTTAENPFTGDNTQLELWCIVAVIALAGLLTLGFAGKKTYHRN